MERRHHLREDVLFEAGVESRGLSQHRLFREALGQDEHVSEVAGLGTAEEGEQMETTSVSLMPGNLHLPP